MLPGITAKRQLGLRHLRRSFPSCFNPCPSIITAYGMAVSIIYPDGRF